MEDYTTAELIGALESLVASLLIRVDDLECALDFAEDYVSDEYWQMLVDLGGDNGEPEICGPTAAQNQSEARSRAMQRHPASAARSDSRAA